MRRIIHLSDLHFGRTRPELLEPLLAVIRDLEPDLVALSGDLTQRARRSQFGAARAFLTGLNMVSPLRGKRTIASTVEDGTRTAAALSGRTAQWARHTAATLESWIEESRRAPG